MPSICSDKHLSISTNKEGNLVSKKRNKIIDSYLGNYFKSNLLNIDKINSIIVTLNSINVEKENFLEVICTTLGKKASALFTPRKEILFALKEFFSENSVITWKQNIINAIVNKLQQKINIIQEELNQIENCKTEILNKKDKPETLSLDSTSIKQFHQQNLSDILPENNQEYTKRDFLSQVNRNFCKLLITSAKGTSQFSMPKAEDSIQGCRRRLVNCKELSPIKESIMGNSFPQGFTKTIRLDSLKDSFNGSSLSDITQGEILLINVKSKDGSNEVVPVAIKKLFYNQGIPSAKVEVLSFKKGADSIIKKYVKDKQQILSPSQCSQLINGYEHSYLFKILATFHQYFENSKMKWLYSPKFSSFKFWQFTNAIRSNLVLKANNFFNEQRYGALVNSKKKFTVDEFLETLDTPILDKERANFIYQGYLEDVLISSTVDNNSNKDLLDSKVSKNAILRFKENNKYKFLAKIHLHQFPETFSLRKLISSIEPPTINDELEFKEYFLVKHAKKIENSSNLGVSLIKQQLIKEIINKGLKNFDLIKFNSILNDNKEISYLDILNCLYEIKENRELYTSINKILESRALFLQEENLECEEMCEEFYSILEETAKFENYNPEELNETFYSMQNSHLEEESTVSFSHHNNYENKEFSFFNIEVPILEANA